MDKELFSILLLAFLVHSTIYTILFIYRKRIHKFDIIEKSLAFVLYILFCLIHYTGSLAALTINHYSNVILEPNFLTIEEADKIVSVTELHASLNNGWMTDRHKSYPTTDLSAYSINEDIILSNQKHKFDVWINNTVDNRVFPLLSSYYNIPIDSLYMKDLFIVKYTYDAQNSLRIHKDSSQLTFNIALSNYGSDFNGGGTKFIISDSTTNIPKGSMLLQEGGVYHSGNVVTEGTRYILIGFVSVKYSLDRLHRTYGELASCLVFLKGQGRIADSTNQNMPLSKNDMIQSTSIQSNSDMTISGTYCRSWLWMTYYTFQHPLNEILIDLFGANTSNSNKNYTHVIISYVVIILILLFVILVFTLLFMCICWEKYYDYCIKTTTDYTNSEKEI
jgi:hypothetical protein